MNYLEDRAKDFKNDLNKHKRPRLKYPEFAEELNLSFGTVQGDGDFAIIKCGWAVEPTYNINEYGLPIGEMWCEPDQLFITAYTSAFMRKGIEGLEQAMKREIAELTKKDKYIYGKRVGYVPDGILFWLQAPGTVKKNIMEDPDLKTYTTFMWQAAWAYKKAIE